MRPTALRECNQDINRFSSPRHSEGREVLRKGVGSWELGVGEEEDGGVGRWGDGEMGRWGLGIRS
uniref:Uncharacterized protein n=1 Tax=Desertifilum tharense IPPAS B-1220 TaxID=1781255 RepID=A0A1E5QJI9_9CYAN|nr:hypothetical protein BH720_12805 [Desertifilum tharense IPPAS B-1220]